MIIKANSFSYAKNWSQSWNGSAHLLMQSTRSKGWSRSEGWSASYSDSCYSCWVWENEYPYSNNWSEDI